MALSSVIPSVFSWSSFDFPERLLDDTLGLFPESRLLLPSFSAFPCRVRSMRRELSQDAGICTVKDDKDSFEVKLDTSGFSPEELSVKTVDNYVVIHGKHEEREDQHGFIKREFTRRYMLPSDVEPEKVISNLSPDGVLIIGAPKKSIESAANERTVPITMVENPKLPVEQK